MPNEQHSKEDKHKQYPENCYSKDTWESEIKTLEDPSLPAQSFLPGNFKKNKTYTS